MPALATKPSTSAKQLRANRRNARRSTGPRTEQGKARAAKNAIVHGIFCADLLLPGEDPRELEPFHDLLLADLAPRDFLERSIAEQYVAAKWRIRRIRGAERDAHGVLARCIEHDGAHSFPDVRRRLRELPRLESLGPGDYDPRPRDADPSVREALREQRYADRQALVPVSATMAASFVGSGDGPFERMSRHEHRLEMSADRALRQLRQLRKDRGPDGTPSEEPVEADGETDVEDAPLDNVHNVQNEPISDYPPASPEMADACAQRSCNVQPVAPTKLTPPARGVVVPPERPAQATPQAGFGRTRKPPNPRERG